MAGDVSFEQLLAWRLTQTALRHPIATPVVAYSFYKSPYLRTIMWKGAVDITMTTLRLTGRLVQMVVVEAMSARAAATAYKGRFGTKVGHVKTVALNTPVRVATAIGGGASAALLVGGQLANSIHDFDSRFLNPNSEDVY